MKTNKWGIFWAKHWRKFVFGAICITVIIFTIIYIILPIKEYYYKNDTETDPKFKLEFWRVVAQAAGALFTLIVSMIALFSDTIKRWFYKPKFKISFECNETHLNDVYIDTLAEGEEPKKIKRIFVRIENLKKTKAEDCQIFIEHIYKKIENNEQYTKKYHLAPTNLLWNDGQKEKTVLHLIPNYLLICEFTPLIDFPREGTQQTSAETNPVLTLCVKNPNELEGNIVLENGVYIFSVLVYSANMRKPEKCYLELYWNGKIPADLIKEKFGITNRLFGELSKPLKEALK